MPRYPTGSAWSIMKRTHHNGELRPTFGPRLAHHHRSGNYYSAYPDASLHRNAVI